MGDISDHSPVAAVFWLRYPSSFVADFASNNKDEGISDEQPISLPMSTSFQVENVSLVCDDSPLNVIPQKIRVVTPLSAEDYPHPLASQCDIIDEPDLHSKEVQGDLNFATKIALLHVRPLNELHLLLWVQYEEMVGHCVVSLQDLKNGN